MKTLCVVHLDKLYRVIVPNTWNVIKNRNLLDMFDEKKYRCTSGALEFTPSFCGVCAAQYFFLCCVLCIIVFLPFSFSHCIMYPSIYAPDSTSWYRHDIRVARGEQRHDIRVARGEQK